MSELREICRARPTTNLYLAARMWLARPEGFGLIPCQPGSKRILKGFGPVLGCVETVEDAFFWFRDRGANLAVLAPETVIILDFDDIQLYDLFVAGWPDLARSYTECSPAGRHVFLSVQGPSELLMPGLTKGVEVKRYCLVAPSQLGKLKYEVSVPGDIMAFPIETIRAALEPFSVSTGDKSHPSPPAPRLDVPRASQGHKTPTPASQGVIEQAKARWPILSYLQYFGVDCKLAGQEGRWLNGSCPFHNDAHPSFWLDTLENRWGCFTENLRGDVVSLHARRLNTGDQAAAARDLLRYDIRFEP